MADFSNYDLADTIAAELNNNLTIVNAIVEKKGLKCKPDFFILGGAAMVFHGLNYSATLDIDTANKITSSIRDDISAFIDDAASEVAVLPHLYQSRAKVIRADLTSIKVYILSQEDLVVNKLLSGRRKDITSVKTSNILNNVNKDLLTQIISTELLARDRTRLYETATAYGIFL